MNEFLKRPIDKLSSILSQLAAEMESIGSSGDRHDVIMQLRQAGMQELQTVDRLSDEEAAERQQIAEALKASNQELKDFIYMTSHDFREPLRKMASFGAILKESLEGKLEPEDQETLEFVIDGTERMAQMIEELLAYSRINTKTIAIEKVDLNDVVQQLENLELNQLLEDTDTHIEILQPLLHVQADPILARQLLRNVIINAIKHRQENLRLHIAITTERISEDVVQIKCEDNGVGIEITNDKDIFKMSLHSRSRQAYEEPGTGLAICKKIVDRHGGRIGIEPKEGVGSTLWFTLPASRGLEPEQEELLVNQTDSQGQS